MVRVNVPVVGPGSTDARQLVNELKDSGRLPGLDGAAMALSARQYWVDRLTSTADRTFAVTRTTW